MSATTETTITDTRRTAIWRATGILNWQVNEFDHGQNFMLTADSAGAQFQAHFDAEQWAAFQTMIGAPS